MTISRFIQWQPNVSLYRKLGWPFACRYLFFLGGLYYAVKRADRENIFRSVESARRLEKEPGGLKELEKKIIGGILSHYYEKIFNAYESLPALTSFLRDHIAPPPLEKIDEALKRNKGVLFVTAHYGGVEYIPIFLAMHRYPLSVVFKCSTSQLQDRLHRRAEELKIKVIDPENGNTASSVLKDLRANRIVFIQCDEIEAWSPSPRETMLFLGRKIGVDRTLSLLGKRSGAEILFGIIHRFDLKTYSFFLETYPDVLSLVGTGTASPSAAILKRLEHYIRSYPHEWYQWKHFAKLEAPLSVASPMKRKETPPVLANPSLRPA